MSRLGQKVRQVLDGLFSKPEKVDNEVAQHTAKIHRPNDLADGQLQEFAAQLKKLFDNRKALSAGHMQILGLAKIREKLGEKWPQFSKKVILIVRDTISKNTDENDFVFELEELNFVILFGSKSKTEAEQHCAMIVARIWVKLFGEESGYQELKATTMVINTDGEIRIDDKQPIQGLVSQIAKRGKPIVYESQDTDLRAQGKTEIKHNYEDNQAGTVVYEVSHNNGIDDPQTLRDKVDTRATWDTQKLVRAEINYLYRPVLSVQNDAILSYFVTPVINGDRRIDYRTSSQITAPTRLKIDLGTLANAINILKTNKANGINIPIASTLCASSLREPRIADRLALELNRLPDDLRKYLNIEISELDPHHCGQAKELMKILEGRFGQMHATVKGLSDFTPYANAGFKCLGMPRSTANLEEADLVHILSVFAEKCKTLDLRSYAHSLRSKNLALTAIKLGFDIISGDAVSPPLKVASKAYRYSINDLFKSEGVTGEFKHISAVAS